VTKHFLETSFPQQPQKISHAHFFLEQLPSLTWFCSEEVLTSLT